MACIKKRRNKWIVDYRVAGIRRVPSFENRAEAEAFKRKLLLRPIDRMTDYFEAKEVTLQEAVDQYLRQVTPTKAPATFFVDKGALDDLAKHFSGKLVNEITLMDLEAYQLFLRRQFLATTINRRFNVIRHFFRKCEDWNYIKDKPTRKLASLKAKAREKRLWTKEEVKRFFSIAPEWLQDIAFFVYETGVRRGEATSLTWKQVNFDKNAIYITSIKGGNERVRSIPMTNSMRDWFLQKKNRNPFLTKPDKRVFLGEDGKPLDPIFVSTVVHRIVHKMGCDGLGLHGMRHTILTELVQSDVSLEKVRQLAGHSTLKTTEQYLHIKLEDQRSMLEELSEKRDVLRPVVKGSGGKW